jgi:alpha-L-rhamnosidase
MVPPGKESLVLERLIENIHQRQGHLSTGFVGILPLMHGLTEFGYADLAYTISTQEDSPSWLYMLKDGGTTIWEYWNDVANRNNSSLGGPFSSWCYLALGGIRLAPDVPAFKKIIIKPEVVGDLTWVKASHKSIYGRIVSEWERKDGRLTLNVTIPANTTATVYVPTENADSVTESGKDAEKAESVKFLRMEEGAAVYQVGSGSYVFVSSYEGKQR